MAATTCRPVCDCPQTTVALPCDAHETVKAGCKTCRLDAAATVVDLRCTVHRAAVEWSASGLAYDRAA
jgi:hypothetical protein